VTELPRVGPHARRLGHTPLALLRGVLHHPAGILRQAMRHAQERLACRRDAL